MQPKQNQKEFAYPWATSTMDKHRFAPGCPGGAPAPRPVYMVHWVQYGGTGAVLHTQGKFQSENLVWNIGSWSRYHEKKQCLDWRFKGSCALDISSVLICSHVTTELGASWWKWDQCPSSCSSPSSGQMKLWPRRSSGTTTHTNSTTLLRITNVYLKGPKSASLFHRLCLVRHVLLWVRYWNVLRTWFYMSVYWLTKSLRVTLLWRAQLCI